MHNIVDVQISNNLEKSVRDSLGVRGNIKELKLEYIGKSLMMGKSVYIINVIDDFGEFYTELICLS